ncbi:RHS repeat-associated core domain-containing protein [Hazenella sp. IB182353]|nr:RHS repeat-associated core domain-containing protein [Polycladospora coralii]
MLYIIFTPIYRVTNTGINQPYIKDNYNTYSKRYRREIVALSTPKKQGVRSNTHFHLLHFNGEDSRSQTLKTVAGYGSSTAYAYDKNGNVTVRKYTTGNTSLSHGYEYDAQNQLTSITADGVKQAWFTYDETDQIASRKTGDSTSTVNQYNGAGDPVSQLIIDKNGNLLDQFKYTYDTKGNITQVVSKAGTTSYVYDELEQLTKEQRPDGTTYAYTFDTVGNRLTRTETKGGISSTTTYTYDAENRLLAVKDQDGKEIASYTYRADGMRKTKTTASGTITFHYDENKNVTHETGAKNQVLASYTFNSIQPVSMTLNEQAYAYQLNVRGDVVALTNASGSIVATYDYDTYGNLVSETGYVENPYNYARYRYDKETELYFLQSRYYNPKYGRFLTRDTFLGFEKEPLSLNKYSYTHNKPVMNIDPDGHISWRFFYYLYKGYRQVRDGLADILWGLY